MPLGTNTPSKETAGKPRPKANGEAQDAIALLKADHQEVDGLFKKFEKAKDGDDDAAKDEIVQMICDALTVHAEIEEEIFYPAAREALDEDEEDVVDEAEVEHAGIKSLVEQLQDMEPDDELYDAKVKVLSEYVKHHVKEEEGEFFPKVKKTDLDLDALGAELAARKDELMEGDDEEEGEGEGEE